MTRSARVTGIVLAVMALAGSVYATGLGVGFKIGTLGLGADVTLNVGQKTNLRGGINGWKQDLTVELDDASVDGDVNLRTFPVLLDYHPMSSGFRLSAGLVYNENAVDLSATPYDVLTFEDMDYRVESLDGDIEFPKIAGYLGFGYGNALTQTGRIQFACDFGVMLQGSPDLSATAVASNTALQERLNADLASEVDEWEDDTSFFKFYPVIMVGFTISL